MRNLRNTQYERWKSPKGKTLTASTWDLANDSLLCCFGPTEASPLIELVRIENKSDSYEHTIITSWDAPCPNPNLPCDEVLSLHCFGDNLTACIVLAGGDIVVVREEPLEAEDRIEIVGSVDEGITAATWSPDEELLAIATRADTVVFMSRNFEGIADVTMTAEDLKASNHVSVGWGKKETQFQGRGAKALRDPTMPEKIDEGVLSPNDDSRVTITWRGDGAFLAVSTVEAEFRRIIRVYSREGVLDSVSEPVDGLEGALSWRPAGNLIAGIQKLQSQVDVVFFERNGLRHGQFSLRLTDRQLQEKQNIKLQWNSDSTVLAVIMAGSIQLWTMGNYHWYLKQEYSVNLLIPGCPVVWHPEKNLRLAVASKSSIDIIESIFTTTRALILPPQDTGAVAVIDGQVIKVTPLRATNIPPPMALYELEVNSNTIDVAFNKDASLISVLHSQGISVFEWKSITGPSSTPVLVAEVILENDETSFSKYQQISFAEKDSVLILSRDGHNSLIQHYAMNGDNRKMEKSSSFRKTSPLQFSTLGIFNEQDSVHPFVQDRKGGLHSLVFNERSLSHCNFPFYVPWIEIIHFNDDMIAFGMSLNGHLYGNSRLLVKNCTSFLVTQAHLIFTTTTHLLKFVHITNVNELEIPPDDPEIDERCRSIERGARLVTAMPTALNVVLQMPRGNLETIYPRAMVLAGVRKLIEEKNYKKAFTHCRTQRVDMNILFDHAPKQFLSCVELFVDQVKKVSYIDLFLSSLRDEDVTCTIYKDTRTSKSSMNEVSVLNNDTNHVTVADPISMTSKVNRICDAFLEIFKNRTSTNLQNIITANVCKSPPALEDGLLVVAQLMKDSPEMADKAVEHICFLADVNKLYDNALGLYDLELTLLVAQQSQKDPREYLPFMQNLQSMSELRRKFSIDDYLGRYGKALGHLYVLDVFSELQVYTQKHNLYRDALSLYRYNPTQHAALTNLYASYLESKSSFASAALAYESLHNYSKATACYLSSGPSYWKQTLFCALSQAPPLSGSSLADLATSLFDALTESKDHYSAATIQLEYLDSIHNACRSFCKGNHFADALHTIALKNRPELLEEVIDPSLGEAFASSTELLSECKNQLLAQIPRIRELRDKALADPLAFYESERSNAEDLPDDVSVAASSRLSTNRSLYTRYTGKGSQGQSIGTAGTGVSRATSKNKRREERKRARGKKGSVYEEEYLVNSVERLITRVEGVRGEVGRLVEALVRRGMWERARAIENSLGEVVGMCGGCIAEVFGAPPSDPVVVTEGEQEAYRPIGADAVLAESIAAAKKRKEAPIVAAFEKLSLLGI